MQKTVIYDFGSNNGDDLPYYLKKADVVVAVEANPALCRAITGRFAAEIAAGRLFVENCVLTTSEDRQPEVPFYIHREEHVRSQFPKPEAALLHEYTQVMLPSRSALDIIRQHGEPHYIKIDIEGYDMEILRSLFAAGIRPPYLSAEIHHRCVFDLLLGTGGYSSFKLVDGASVGIRYVNSPIQTAQGVETYSFPEHSAGPFGEDIEGPWLSAGRFSRVLNIERVGWKDVHVTTVTAPSPHAGPSLLGYWGRMVAYFVGRRVLPQRVRIAVRCFIKGRPKG